MLPSKPGQKMKLLSWNPSFYSSFKPDLYHYLRNGLVDLVFPRTSNKYSWQSKKSLLHFAQIKTERRKSLLRHLWPERMPCRLCGKQMSPSYSQPADENSSPVTSSSQFPLLLSDDSFQSLFPNCCLSLLGTQIPHSAKLKCRNLLRFILWISITWDKKVRLIYILS